MSGPGGRNITYRLASAKSIGSPDSAWATSVSTNTCSLTSTKREIASMNGGSTTTPIDRTRASNGLTPPEFAVLPVSGIIGTGSPYKQGQLREQVKWTLLASPGRK